MVKIKLNCFMELTHNISPLPNSMKIYDLIIKSSQEREDPVNDGSGQGCTINEP